MGGTMHALSAVPNKAKKRGEMAEKSYEEEHPTKAFGWAARDQSGVLSPFKFSRRLFPLLYLVATLYNDGFSFFLARFN